MSTRFELRHHNLADCPNESADCNSEAYFFPGDVVVISAEFAGLDEGCAACPGVHGKTAG